MAIIADTGALVALANSSDHYHQAVKQFFAKNREPVIVPCPVVPETCFMLRSHLGLEAELAFLKSLERAELLVEHQTPRDLSRAIEINERYAKSQFGVVDATVMAMAERLSVDAILTLDRRDFEIYRPAHCPRFRLIPDRIIRGKSPR